MSSRIDRVKFPYARSSTTPNISGTPKQQRRRSFELPVLSSCVLRQLVELLLGTRNLRRKFHGPYVPLQRRCPSHLMCIQPHQSVWLFRCRLLPLLLDPYMYIRPSGQNNVEWLRNAGFVHFFDHNPLRWCWCDLDLASN